MRVSKIRIQNDKLIHYIDVETGKILCGEGYNIGNRIIFRWVNCDTCIIVRREREFRN